MLPHNITRTKIKVLLWGTEIGTLTWVPAQKNSYFNFSQEYFRMGYDLCPITHPLGDPSTRLAIYGENERLGDRTKGIYQSLPPFLADSLPDSWGNAVFDKWFRDNKIDSAEKTPVTKLSFIGKRAMGAFEFVPELQGSLEKKSLLLPLLYQEALALERELSERSVDGSSDINMDVLRMLGTSAGGRQKKVIVSRTPEGNYISGQTSADKNDRHFILKFNTPEYCMSEIEMTYYEMCRHAGINMMHSELVEVDGIKHFLTERFDRRNGQKVMTQTLAAINPEANSYEELFQTCRRLCLPEGEISELYRRTVFNFLANNTDDHKKNFSFLMADDYSWHLAPAYDMTFIISTDGNKPVTGHCMPLAGKLENIAIRDLVDFGKRMGVKAPEKIISKVSEALDAFDEYAVKNGVDSYFRQMIKQRIAELTDKEPEKIGKSFMIDGWDVQNLSFEKTLKGNIHMCARIFGHDEKLVVTPKKALYQEILDKGFNEMSISDMKAIFLEYMVPILRSRHKL